MSKRVLLLLLFLPFSLMSQNDFPISGNALIQNAKLIFDTSGWLPSLITLQDTHYTPHQVYHFQIESDGLKIKQDDTSNYLFKSGGDFIVRNGNALLGQGTPLFKLHIKDPLGGAAIGLERGGKLWRFDLENNSDRLFIGHTEQGQLFTFRKNGNFGIGTINPAEKFEVNTSSSIHAIFKGSFSGIQGIQIEREAGDKIRLVTNYLGYGGGLESSSKIRFSVNGNSLDSPAMIVNEMGNVGIGTSSPDAKLTVKGKVHAEEVKVDLSVPGPDYVFKEGYNLKSLEEVQNYINEHGHLPNVPSAKEMEKDGVELGKMNMKLLEKIEELTLYIIELKKGQTALEKQNRELLEQLKSHDKK